MPDPIADLNAYKAGVDADVTTKVAVDSISPVEVGAIGTDLADLLLEYLQSINNQAYFQGTGVPPTLMGADLDLYYQQLISGFSLWRKQSGTWVLKVTMVYSAVEDGIITGLRAFIEGTTVTVTSGTWAIDNVRYSKATQTQFTVPAADANFLRYDLIYADENDDVLYLSGTASSTPVYPTQPADSVIVDYVVVPSTASGAPPYLLSGGSSGGTGTGSGFIYFTQTSPAVVSNVPGIVCDLATGVVTLADVGGDFPILSQNGILRGQFDILIGSDWIPTDVPPDYVTYLKDGSGQIISCSFFTGQTSITAIRGRIQ